MKPSQAVIPQLLSVIFFGVMFWAAAAHAADTMNCLMCHKHGYMGRIDANGKLHNYNVDEAMYSRSVHRNVDCTDCHTYITKIPHAPVTQQVSCANTCHIKPPFSQEMFSHAGIVELFNGSIHGSRPDDSAQMKQAKPDCKFCHQNPLYTKIPEQNVPYAATLKRCLNCHPQNGVIQAYQHITHRLRKKTSRSPRQIDFLCAECHADMQL